MKNAKTELGMEPLVYDCNFKIFGVWRVTSLAALEPLSGYKINPIWAKIQLGMEHLGYCKWRLFWGLMGDLPGRPGAARWPAGCLHFRTLVCCLSVEQPVKAYVVPVILSFDSGSLNILKKPFLPMRKWKCKILWVCFIGETNSDFLREDFCAICVDRWGKFSG